MRFPKLFKPKGTTERKHFICERNNAIYWKYINKGKTISELMNEYGLSYWQIRNILEEGGNLKIKQHKKRTA